MATRTKRNLPPPEPDEDDVTPHEVVEKRPQVSALQQSLRPLTPRAFRERALALASQSDEGEEYAVEYSDDAGTLSECSPAEIGTQRGTYRLIRRVKQSDGSSVEEEAVSECVVSSQARAESDATRALVAGLREISDGWSSMLAEQRIQLERAREREDQHREEMRRLQNENNRFHREANGLGSPQSLNALAPVLMKGIEAWAQQQRIRAGHKSDDEIIGKTMAELEEENPSLARAVHETMAQRYERKNREMQESLARAQGMADHPSSEPASPPSPPSAVDAPASAATSQPSKEP